jgi:hypothetical protein
MIVSDLTVRCDSPGCSSTLTMPVGGDGFVRYSAEKLRDYLDAQEWSEDHKGRDLCPDCSPPRST